MSLTAQVLGALPAVSDPNLIVGTDHFDDAGVYKIDDSTALVVTLDFFPPLVDDPYAFGQIAAANALSDIYAMGAKPLTALNIVGFPDTELPAELLVEILRGGFERVSAAGAVLAGGHSVRDTEIKYGLSVTGIIDPNRIMSNAGAKPGDMLVLTKPLGVGTLTSAAKMDKIPQSDLAEAIAVMVELNAGASQASIEVGAHAVTDITGFGLLGHACEMASASDVTIEIDAAGVPLLPHSLKFAADGIITRVYEDVLEYLGKKVQIGNVDESLVAMLADAQTSGGLLISVAPEKTADLIAALKKHKTFAADVVGQVTAKSEASIIVR